jgi:hypothetical protein
MQCLLLRIKKHRFFRSRFVERETLKPSGEVNYRFKAWRIQRQLLEVLPKSPVGVALQCALNHWKYLIRTSLMRSH